jgi:signal transduction histidine kinase
MGRLRQAFRDLSLRAKVASTLAVGLVSIVALYLLLLIPFLARQRAGLLEKDKRLLSILRENYGRELIYDLLSESEESAGAHLADLARQRGLVWARLTAGEWDLTATADPRLVAQAFGAFAQPFRDEPGLVLLVRSGGRAELVTASGRTLARRDGLLTEALPAVRTEARAGAVFEERRLDGRTVLYFASELLAGDQAFGRLHLVYSLADLDRSESLSRTLVYGLAGAAFVLLLVLLNLLVGRIVLRPVGRVEQAMSRAAKGELDQRLPVHSKDELGRMADAFNRMVVELHGSKEAVEGYSRDLEAKVAARTRALQQSELALLDLKNRLATVLANVGTGVISLDEAGRIDTFNERAAEILGVRGSVQGRRLDEVLEGDACQILPLVASVGPDGRARAEAQLACQLPRGRRTLSVVASALPGARGAQGTVVVCEDLTQILSTQRLEAWKEAVERVIHEIKNPLTPVALAAETLKSAHGSDRARFEELFPSAIDMVLSSVRDLRVLIAEFGRFSRLPEARLQRCDLNELVRTALAPYASGAGGAALALDLGEGLPGLMADPDQLKRVLLNVVNNALEAMEGRGGELRVATFCEGGEAVVAVSDQGGGVDDVDRIFEPYYTTKAKGTGLGLAIARQIVEEHRGRITVTSRVGHGTTVEVRLPAAPAPSPAEV